MRSKRSVKPAALTVKRPDGSPSTDPLESSNLFKKFFESTFTDFSGSFYPLLSPRPFAKLLETPTFSVDDVERQLRSCNPNSTQGPDGIHPRVLSEAAKVLAVPVFNLFRYSLSTGELPSAWRQAHVIPIFKAGDRNLAGSYRPISLTSVLCKILERLLKREMLSHLLTNKLLSPAQHGFLPGHSCLTNLLLFLDNLTDAYDKGLITNAIFFDFAKAFDKVPHAPLTQKLSAYGISGQFLNWISSFLNGRTFQVKLGPTLSELAPVTSGVPQGSVLGPLLFLVYVNDLPDVIRSSALFYADDLKVWNSLDPRKLQEDVASICEWSSVWSLPINPSKCLHMAFGKDQPNAFSLPPPANSPIIQTNLTKDLGVWLSSNLSFSMHHATVAKQAFKVLHMIRRTFKHIDAVDFAFLYGTYVRPILEYCSQVTFSGLVKDTNCLERVQRAATKMVTGLKNVPYDKRLKILNLYPLETRRARGDLILAHSIFLKGEQTLYFSPNNIVNLRGHCHKLFKTYTRTRARKRFFTCRVVNSWNKLSEGLVTAATRDSFKRSLDVHLGLHDNTNLSHS
ncbi:MAG: RNA-directed DNA polymerase [Clostridium sp.]